MNVIGFILPRGRVNPFLIPCFGVWTQEQTVMLEKRNGGEDMKITITTQEAIDKGIWPQVMKLFGRDREDEVWPQETYVLTEEQARGLGLIR